VTGEQDALSATLPETVARLREATTLPICVGFGISRPDQAAAVARLADGVVVGSALVRLVEEHGGNGDLPALLEERVRELAEAARR
jgi:tryptophan synthase alpha chain